MARIQFTDWTIPVAQVGSRPGQTKEIDQEFPAPEGIGDTIVGVKPGAPVHVAGQFDSIVDGLIFTGTLTAPVDAVCARCDVDLSRDFAEQVTAFFPYENKGEDLAAGKDDEETEIIAGEEESGDLYPLLDNGSFADIEPLIRDTFVTALPLQMLCRPDCKGLCPQCGADLNEEPAHVHDVVDPRFDALAALKAQLEQQEK
ncbi:YceD family protein [Bifidobacterium choloepi]|uniref:DUF177 domain-containing protein n=1 Tax=Bifidobacterium choloepi TaxID=2614131 RepID=A0A6I5N0V7_9BIFI|nr:DUF177 domain-containing protein [Bifidobacterium choloepi]NEG69765.1 DUF177 domain-containing protein [Bifidobacterium choloepi]